MEWFLVCTVFNSSTAALKYTSFEGNLYNITTRLMLLSFVLLKDVSHG